MLFISFVRPKEMNQRKGRRKRKIQSFCPPATQSRNGATKKTEFGFAELVRLKPSSVHAVSGLPAHQI
jgi:hypothetical protein